MTKFVAPALVVGFGWAMVPQVYAVAMLVTAIAFWFFTYSDPKHLIPGHITYRRQLEVLRDPAVWKYCQYYSIVFGGYVALSLWMVNYYVGEFGLDIRIAALLAACFSLPGRRAARHRRLDVGQVGRAQGDLVGHVGQLDLPVPAVVSHHQLHDHHGQRSVHVHARAQRLDVHRR